MNIAISNECVTTAISKNSNTLQATPVAAGHLEKPDPSTSQEFSGSLTRVYYLNLITA